MHDRSFRSIIGRTGWSLGATIGALVFAVFGVIAGLTDHDPGNGLGETILDWLAGVIPAGIGFGVVIGGLAQWTARKLPDRPTKAAVTGTAPADDTPPLATSPEDTEGLDGGTYAAYYRRCWESVSRFRDIANTVPAGPAQDWLLQLAADLELELREALRLARYGSILAPVSRGRTDTTLRRITDRLTEAERAFAGTVRRASDIAINLTEEHDFVAIRAQLDVLSKEAPHLRSKPSVEP